MVCILLMIVMLLWLNSIHFLVIGDLNDFNF